MRSCMLWLIRYVSYSLPGKPSVPDGWCQILYDMMPATLLVIVIVIG